MSFPEFHHYREQTLAHSWHANQDRFVRLLYRRFGSVLQGKQCVGILKNQIGEGDEAVYRLYCDAVRKARRIQAMGPRPGFVSRNFARDLARAASSVQAVAPSNQAEKKSEAIWTTRQFEKWVDRLTESKARSTIRVAIMGSQEAAEPLLRALPSYQVKHRVRFVSSCSLSTSTLTFADETVGDSCNDVVWKQPFHTLEIPSESVDLVVLSLCLHHLTSAFAHTLLYEMRRILVHNGHVALLEPDVRDNNDEDLCDAEHAFCALCTPTPTLSESVSFDWSQYVQTYCVRYLGIESWRQVLALSYSCHVEPDVPIVRSAQSMLVWALFRKQQDVTFSDNTHAKRTKYDKSK